MAARMAARCAGQSWRGVQGLQWGADAKYTKAIGALKHYTMYSVEAGRGRTYFEISS